MNIKKRSQLSKLVYNFFHFSLKYLANDFKKQNVLDVLVNMPHRLKKSSTHNLSITLLLPFSAFVTFNVQKRY